MNKKSAVVTAGGLAASFVAGIAAVSFNWGLGTPSPSVVNAARPSPARKHVKPIVKHRRIVVHKKAPAPKGPPSPPGSRTISVAPPAQTPPVVTTSGSHGGGGESDDGGERGGGDGGD
jgi:hypothetical protein